LLVHATFHFQTPVLERCRSYGWIGVDLFFVISGYLITSILVSAKDQPHYYRNFYARRGLRIWPLYYLMLAYVFLLSAHLGPWFDQHIDFSVFKWQYYVCYIQNLILPQLEKSAFSLQITWSLCVEEQFYLVWPFFVRIFRERWLLLLAVAVVLAGVPFRIFLQHMASDFGFFYTFARLDPIAIGAVVALRPRWLRYGWLAAPWAGWLLWHGDFVWVYLASALTFGWLVSYAVTHQNALLACAPMRYIGRISYGIYIWHPIVFLLYMATPFYRVPAHFGLTGGVLHIAMEYALAVGIAAVSWKYLEKPILDLKRHFASNARPGYRQGAADSGLAAICSDAHAVVEPGA
jgi:peptidoglycan/LPS O-acetylase OafA/YrhL